MKFWTCRGNNKIKSLVDSCKKFWYVLDINVNAVLMEEVLI